MSQDETTSQKPVDGEGKALIRERQKVKQLEKTVDHKTREIDRLHKENERLKKQNEKLKQQLAGLRKAPKWAKASKPEGADGKSGKKKGPKKGHTPNIRERPEKVDREVTLIAPNSLQQLARRCL